MLFINSFNVFILVVIIVAFVIFFIFALAFLQPFFFFWASEDKWSAFHAVTMVPDGRLALMTGSQSQPSLQGWGQQDTSHCLTPSCGYEPRIKHTAQLVCWGLWRAEHMFRENNLFIMTERMDRMPKLIAPHDQQELYKTEMNVECSFWTKQRPAISGWKINKTVHNKERKNLHQI